MTGAIWNSVNGRFVRYWSYADMEFDALSC